MRNFLVLSFFLISSFQANAQDLRKYDVTIARDSFGVPHIFGTTDADVAYGLGWTQCEDQFKTLQELLAACRGYLGEINGKDGIVADIGIKYMGIADFVDQKYDKDVTGDFKTYLEAYVDGVNRYAGLHQDEVLLKKLFPVTGKDVIVGYLLGNVEISGAGSDLQLILNGRIKKDLEANFPKGSNAIAISNRKTTDGKTYLAINSHQPLEGWYSWYEAHLHSEEGLNIIGGTFAGGVCIFLGSNENLGWAHTVNHADFSDVFKLTVNTSQDAYLYDNQWVPLEEIKIKSKVKLLGFLKIPITRKMYKSIYGPTIKSGEEFYAWRFSAGTTIKMAEQWFRMNKAQNLDEFKKALEIKGIVSTNIVYADKDHNIFYISNGRIPDRNPKYNWDEVLPGNTSETFTGEEYLSLDSLPQVLNPSSGWVFNTNNTPYTSSAESDSPAETDLNKIMGYQESGDENNRSLRFLELINQYDKLSYEDFKTIKYDDDYPSIMRRVRGISANTLFSLEADSYPKISDAILLIQNWDRSTDAENTSATMFLATLYKLNEARAEARKADIKPNELEISIKAIRLAKAHLIKHYGSIIVPLGKFQRHSRGDINLPIGGGPDVLNAIYSSEQKNGTYRAIGGESYIQMVRFSENGVEIESINAFGNSEKEGDPNATNQMTYFTNRKLKKMTFDKEEIMRTAVRVYKPD